MERKVNFRVMGREGETLSRMYDETRESLICALPTRCYKVSCSSLVLVLVLVVLGARVISWDGC